MLGKVLLLGLMVSLAWGVVLADDTAGDWRTQGSDAQKLENLVRAVPSTSRLMLQMGERYQNLYWAAKLDKWAFADYQIEEIEELVKLLQITRPKRAETAQVFLDNAIAPLEKALRTRNWDAFYKGFAGLRAQCMSCHVKNKHAFIILPEHPKCASSPVLNLGRCD